MNNKRQKTQKRAQNNQHLTEVNPTRGPIAPRLLTTLKYFALRQSPGTVIDYVYNLNSIFSPPHTSAGHQPYGHDTYQTLYNRYRVFRCDVTVEAVSNNAHSITVVANNSQTSLTDFNLASESPNAVNKTATAARSAKFHKSYDLAFITGATKNQYGADDRYHALFGTSPTEQICLHVVSSGLDGTAPASQTIGFSTTMVFHVEMFDPKELSQSFRKPDVVDDYKSVPAGSPCVKQ